MHSNEDPVQSKTKANKQTNKNLKDTARRLTLGRKKEKKNPFIGFMILMPLGGVAASPWAEFGMEKNTNFSDVIVSSGNPLWTFLSFR